MIHVTETWHKDAKGLSRPESFVGKRFFHVKSAGLYEITGFTFNATTDCWAFLYAPDRDMDPKFQFTRDMHEFLDGRFVEVKA